MFLDDNLICMKNSCPNLLSEDNTVSNINNIHETETVVATNQNETNQVTPVRINFNPREWTFHKMHKSIGGRSFITDFMGNLTEAYSLGNWHKQKTEIQSPEFLLDKNTHHTFSFWLNGGENDRFQEVCELDIIFDGDWDNRYTYKLNRNYIRYEKYYKGWYLYEIPFTTLDNEHTMLQFVSMDAPCAILPAWEKSFYDNLEHEEPNTTVPQRPNLVFPESYPRDANWSWKVFKQNNGLATNQEDIISDMFDRIALQISDTLHDSMADDVKDIIKNHLETKGFSYYSSYSNTSSN